MGWLGNLLRPDPARLLEQAEERLAEGSAVHALELAEKARRREDSAPARELEARAREAVIVATLESAAEAEAAGDLEDAVDWLEAALVRLDGDARWTDVEASRIRLEQQIALAPPAMIPVPEVDPYDGPDETEPGHDLLAVHLESLNESWTERYRSLPDPVLKAWVELSEGLPERASEVLEPAAEETDIDPIVRFERARCRLILGDAEGAREDAEAVWPALGDDPLDRAGFLCVPSLWAESTLAAGDPGAVADRLAEVTDAGGRVALVTLRAEALLAAERLEEARIWLEDAMRWYPSESTLSFMLAHATQRLGDPLAARQLLEAAVAPSCVGGNCGRPARHLPSLRLLARLHLEEGGQPERVTELMAWVLADQGGRASPEDEEILARLG